MIGRENRSLPGLKRKILIFEPPRDKTNNVSVRPGFGLISVLRLFNTF